MKIKWRLFKRWQMCVAIIPAILLVATVVLICLPLAAVFYAAEFVGDFIYKLACYFSDKLTDLLKIIMKWGKGE